MLQSFSQYKIIKVICNNFNRPDLISLMRILIINSSFELYKDKKYYVCTTSLEKLMTVQFFYSVKILR